MRDSFFIDLSLVNIMGLDIDYYTDIEFVHEYKERVEGDEKEEEEDDYEEEDEEGCIRFHLDQCAGFEDRSDGIQDGVYKGKKKDEFRAGSYGHHMRFRRELCFMMGYKVGMDMLPGVIPERAAFRELIYMSDCDGFIGHKTSEKLYRDFERYKDKAEKQMDEYSFSSYCQCMEAFEVAHKNGVVVFG